MFQANPLADSTAVTVTSNSAASGRMSWSMLPNRNTNFCEFDTGSTSFGGGSTYSTRTISSNCGWSAIPTSVRMIFQNYGPVNVSITALAIKSYEVNVTSLQPGDLLNLTSVSASTQLALLSGSESWGNGLVEVTGYNDLNTPQTISIALSRTGCNSDSYVSCPAPARGSCIINHPICYVQSPGSPIFVRLPSSRAGSYPFYREALWMIIHAGSPGISLSVRNAGATAITSGANIGDRPALAAYRLPTGVSGPVRLVFHTPDINVGDSLGIWIQHGGKCDEEDASNFCDMDSSTPALSCTLTMICTATDIVIVQSRGASRPNVSITVQSMSFSSTLNSDSEAVGSSVTLRSTAPSYSEWIGITVPIGVSAITFKLSEANCTACPECGPCVNWAIQNGCTLSRLAPDCQNSAECYAVVNTSTLGSSFFIKASVGSAVLSSSITINDISGCASATQASSPFCHSVVSYPIHRDPVRAGRPLLDSGAELLFTQVDSVFNLSHSGACSAAIRYISCVENYAHCGDRSAATPSPQRILCREKCQDALSYCPLSTREDLFFLCSETDSCAAVQFQPPAFIPPPPTVAPTTSPAPSAFPIPSTAPAGSPAQISSAPLAAPAAAPQSSGPPGVSELPISSPRGGGLAPVSSALTSRAGILLPWIAVVVSLVILV